MTERERAEQLWQKLTRLEASQEAQDIYIAREYVDLIVAFAREERARGLEDLVRDIDLNLEGAWKDGDFEGALAVQAFAIDKAKHLREEGKQR